MAIVQNLSKTQSQNAANRELQMVLRGLWSQRLAGAKTSPAHCSSRQDDEEFPPEAWPFGLRTWLLERMKDRADGWL